VPSGNGLLRLGTPEAAKAPVITSIAGQWDGPTLVLAPTPAAAQALTDELTLYSRDPAVMRLPEQERLPYELTRDDPVAEHERERALGVLARGEHTVVVASWAAISGHCAGPERRAAGVTVRSGQPIGPQALLDALERAGYEREPVADRPGTMARHGGIVDVFPPSADDPLRIEFFGDEVESIRVIQLESQRSRERVGAAHFDPVSTGTREAHEAAAKLLERLREDDDTDGRFVEELARIAEGGRTQYPELFESLLFDSSGLDHLHASTLVVIDDHAAGIEALGHSSRTKNGPGANWSSVAQYREACPHCGWMSPLSKKRSNGRQALSSSNPLATRRSERSGCPSGLRQRSQGSSGRCCNRRRRGQVLDGPSS
jgi:transcription-repair coupling factor (superfamily II helicase)